MSSRAEQKARLRAEREATEARERVRERRNRRLASVGAIAVAAAVVVIVAIVVSSSGTHRAGGPLQDTSAVAQTLGGIPQQGPALGAKDAPVTLVEYADLRCPVCRAFTLQTLPALIDRYVRTGKLRVVLKLQTFVGKQYAPGDSERAARFAIAAGAQNHEWNVAEVFYHNQGDETTSYVTDAFLRQIGDAITGLDTQKALAGRQAAGVTSSLKASASDFVSAGFTGTPSFRVGRTGGSTATLSAPSLSVDEFSGPIDKLLKQ